MPTSIQHPFFFVTRSYDSFIAENTELNCSIRSALLEFIDLYCIHARDHTNTLGRNSINEMPFPNSERGSEKTMRGKEVGQASWQHALSTDSFEL